MYVMYRNYNQVIPVCVCTVRVTTTGVPTTTTPHTGPLARICEEPPLIVDTLIQNPSILIGATSAYSTGPDYSFEEGGKTTYLHLLHFGFRSTVPAYYYVVIVTCSRYRSCTGRSVQVAGRTGPRVLCADTRVQL